MRRFEERSAGFALVELLVVIGIIGVLVSILLPAVQSVREAARRISCMNNIRQLALAAHNYESAHRIFPGGGVLHFGDPSSNPKFDPRSGPMLSWIVLILPHMEEQNLYDLFDFSATVLEQANEPQEAQPTSLLCPSDGSAGRFYSDPTQTNKKRFAKGNYAAFASPFHIRNQFRFPGAISGKGKKIAEIRDGTSNTLMLSEVRTRGHEQDQRGAWALPWNGSTLLAFDMHNTGRSAYEASPHSLGQTQLPNSGIAEFDGSSLIRGNMDILYGCPEPNLAQLEGMPCGDYEKFRWLSSAPRSRHPGGVNVVYADGHTRFYLNEVDEFAMAYAISINDGHWVIAEQ